jgi:hypothetical protein
MEIPMRRYLSYIVTKTLFAWSTRIVEKNPHLEVYGEAKVNKYFWSSRAGHPIRLLMGGTRCKEYNYVMSSCKRENYCHLV